MPPSPAAPPASSRVRRAVATFLLVLAAPLLVACGDEPPAATSDPEAGVVDAIQQTLRQRARALVGRDRLRFDRTYARRDADFAAEQGRYYGNLEQLPIETLRFEVSHGSLEPDGDSDAYWAVVTVRLQLEGYDVAPVITRDRWRFAPARDGRRYLVTATTDPEWGRAGPQPQPWDLGEIEVRDGPGVLAVLDAGTVVHADEVIDSVSESRFAVRSVLPVDIDDPGGVVVYVLSDGAFLDSLDGLPVTDPDRLDGATVPVPRDAETGGGKVASYRIVLNPDVLDGDEEGLDRLVRHELTHVAVGDRGRGVPLWLSEGLAEYVSVRPISPSARRLQTDALSLAASGVDRLPADEDFAGEDAEGWYAVSWWVCEYVAANYGEDALWALLDGLAGGADQESVVSEQLGISTTDLVTNGVDLMTRTYS
ncbi:hypothetical protein DJ010_06205 [Nocardioides silvaticus]|uniref:Peptidase MA-like domain-containing protein n=1 Tax=Nocardioides silvaticus TaxID=2201891 RepID=A0A316TGM3_9ACTN|nr:hypothetical protein [Nocardioides silvaticus]PWN03677.1 hypothetical protein DJ010_06205 [Nocardioides silvaticus]